jgi:hypothetical protein
MSLSSPSRREWRTIALGLLIGLPILAYRVVYVPYRSALTEGRDELEAQRDLMSRELAMLAETDKYPVAYRTADSTLRRTIPRLFDHPDDVLATAQLASYVANQAVTSRAFLHEAITRNSHRSPEGVRTLEVDIRVESDLEGILRFLEALERGPKLIVMERLEVVPGERPPERGRPAMPLLMMTASVRGYGLTDIGKTARPPILGQLEDER